MVGQLTVGSDSKAPAVRLALAEAGHADLGVRLLMRLQTSLEPDRLASLFFEDVRSVLAVEALEYLGPDGQRVLKIGRLGRHRASYGLNFEDRSLGQLILARRRPFSGDDLALLEEALSLLQYPLRNAWMHQEALNDSRRDPLTGLYNRTVLGEELGREVSLAHRHGEPLALAVMDVDHFKDINDRLGHAAGDEVLRQVAGVLRRCARQTDLVFRYAGDEFVIATSHTDGDGVRVLSERVLAAVRRAVLHTSGEPVEISLSIGTAVLRPGDDVQKLFDRADHALLAAKRRGRNRVMDVEDLHP